MLRPPAPALQAPPVAVHVRSQPLPAAEAVGTCVAGVASVASAAAAGGAVEADGDGVAGAGVAPSSPAVAAALVAAGVGVGVVLTAPALVGAAGVGGNASLQARCRTCTVRALLEW